MGSQLRPAIEFSAPLYVAWELTHHCNARCIHCYSNSSPDAVLGDEMPLDRALRAIDQLAEAGVLVLAFSGGEPLMHRHWETLVGRAVRSGISVNVGSNGSCITNRNADKLKDLKIKSVTISLDSHVSSRHDAFRKFDGLFEKSISAIRRLVERDVRVVVGFTPTRKNWKDGRGVIDLAYELGADAVNLSEYVPAGRGGLELALSPNELPETLVEWIDTRKEFANRMQIVWHDCRVGMLVSEEEKRKYVGCGAGRLVARIMPDGTVTPCVFLSTPIGSLANESFHNLWSRSLLMQQFRERTGHVTGNCGDCEHLQTCGGCRAVAFAYSRGNPLAGDPHCWIKDFGDSRAQELIAGEGLPI